MKRDYDTGTSEGVTFFVGTEIEKTPAFGMLTLFVVGTPPVLEILRIVNDTKSYLDDSKRIKHIYFGANQSFPKFETNDATGWKVWEEMIMECLECNIWCTLDLDVSQVEGLLEGPLVEQRQFIPQLSVKIPYLTQLGYNATIKLDDKDFKASNPGVWCHTLHSLTGRDTFTSWDEYGKDEIIK
jgi:hypothetical protein